MMSKKARLALPIISARWRKIRRGEGLMLLFMFKIQGGDYGAKEYFLKQ